MPEIFSPQFAMAAAVVALAGMVRGFSGFGGGLVMIPFLALLYAPPTAVAVAMLSGLFGGLQMLPWAWRRTNWREVLPLSLISAPVTPLGTLLLVSGDPQIMRKVIGAVVLVVAVVLLRGWTWRGRRNLATAAAAGSLAGLINGLGGVGGPLAMLYLLASGETAEVQRANITMVITFFTLFIFTPLALAGAISVNQALQGLMLTLPFSVGVYLGSRMFHRVPELYRRASLVIIFVSGLTALFG
ncbi:MAG: sulfite exporter TauE/SafE family protein [Alphaproteobacteria bacterium]|nr:sulfite exporter TauE/SafE family protein [Alphaproteobacteria bacterium]